MPFPFALPSTSLVNYSIYFSSTTHPLLPLTATNHRTVLRNALKKHRRLPPTSQPAHLSTIHSAITDYVPYLLALSAGLSNQLVAGEDIDITLNQEPEPEWRATLTATLPGRAPPRLKGHGLDYELAFLLSTLAHTHTLLARRDLHPLYAPTPPTPAHRAAAITAATKHLLHAHALHSHLVHALGRAPPAASASGTGPVDISVPLHSALASLALAEATLLAVLKDDPYPPAAAQERSRLDRDWMVKAPDMPKVRAHLFARLCLAAAEHAGMAGAMLAGAAAGGEGGGRKKVDERLVRYVDAVGRVARGRACRFLGVDAEVQGRVGEGIGWVRAGRREVLGGVGREGDGLGGGKGLARWRREWGERREDRRLERGGAEWGVDAGVAEEGRVLEMLERKWGKLNDTMNTQLIPPADQLLATMPSGREIHTPKPYVPPSLDEDVLVRMRAPPDGSENAVFGGDGDSSSEDGGGEDRELPGAFPAGPAYGGGGESAYY